MQSNRRHHPRYRLDALVALGMLERKDGVYSNMPETDFFLDRAKPTYIGGFLEMASARLYPFWGSLADALRSGQPQNEIKTGGEFFPVLYGDPVRLKQFLQAMTGISMGAAKAIASKFPWGQSGSSSTSGVPRDLSPFKWHSRILTCPGVASTFRSLARFSRSTSRRLGSVTGSGSIRDFFRDPMPEADVLAMGRILHDWDLEEKRMLLAKAYSAVPKGGALIIYESLIDDERRHNVFGLLMSLNMLIETKGGFDFTGADCTAWMREVGFSETYVEHLDGPDSMVVGIK